TKPLGRLDFRFGFSDAHLERAESGKHRPAVFALDRNGLLVSRHERLDRLLRQGRSRCRPAAKLRAPPWKAPPASDNAKPKSHLSCGTHDNLQWAGRKIEGPCRVLHAQSPSDRSCCIPQPPLMDSTLPR